MNLTRYLAAITLLLASLASATDAPVPIDVLRTGEFVMNGIVYETRSELAAALRQLKPEDLRIRPAADASYDFVAEALRALGFDDGKKMGGFPCPTLIYFLCYSIG